MAVLSLFYGPARGGGCGWLVTWPSASRASAMASGGKTTSLRSDRFYLAPDAIADARLRKEPPAAPATSLL